tara:strand:+ start:623 stop:1204 length:582 start_codon:yes stop_codon:yes gene_type:complete
VTLKLNGSSSGYTAIDAPAAAGSNTLVLPADNGSNGEFLKTNGSGTLDWSAAGKILQVLTTATEVATSTQSTSYVDATGMTLSITPTSTSSKIIIVCCGTANVIGSTYWGYYTILRGSTDLGNPSNGKGLLGLYSNSSNADTHTPMTIFYVDSPNTTSSTTYKLQLKVGNGSGYAKFNQQPQKATFTLLEVGP